MTTIEFNKQLWPYAVARFTDIDHWLGQLPKEPRHERDTTQRDVLTAWQGVLTDVSLGDAKKALDIMAKGDEERPRTLSDYPATIRRVARRIRNTDARSTDKPQPKRIDQPDGGFEYAYRCGICEDQGTVVVWHPDAHTAARKEPKAFIEENRGAYTCAVPCCCELGRSYLHLGPRLSSQMIVKPGVIGMRPIEARRQLVELLAARVKGSGPNDFGDYGQPIT